MDADDDGQLDHYILKGVMVEQLNTSMKTLDLSVNQLNGKLDTLNERQAAAEDLAGRFAESARRRVRGLYMLVAGVVVLVLGLIGVIGWVYSISRHTDDKFDTYRAQSAQNCLIRNQQADGTRNFVGTLEALIPANPTNAALSRALDGFLKSIPANIDCNKLVNP